MKLAWVLLRYGENIAGGAEHHARMMAEHLTAAGIASVDVLTTTATVHYLPRNDLAPGVTSLNGVQVLRFPIDTTAFDLLRFQELSGYLHHRPEGLSLQEQNEWARHMTFSADLCAHLDSHQAEYDIIIVMPYYYTLHAAAIAPHKTYVWACLHDEPSAYTAPVIRMLNRARGVIFNTEPELALAQRLGMTNPNIGIVAMGIDPLSADTMRFHKETPQASPFIVYAGRLEDGKNVNEMYELFTEHKRRYPGQLCLRLLGKGPNSPPARQDIVVEGFVSPQRKADVFSASRAIIAPSKSESLSLTLMEGWSLGLPVIVNGACEVMRYQVERCGGGLHYSCQDEFDVAVNTYVTDDTARCKAGEAGRQFVQRRYNWQRVLGDFVRLVH